MSITHMPQLLPLAVQGHHRTVITKQDNNSMLPPQVAVAAISTWHREEDWRGKLQVHVNHSRQMQMLPVSDTLSQVSVLTAVDTTCQACSVAAAAIDMGGLQDPLRGENTAEEREKKTVTMYHVASINQTSL
jgi:hypothetical protein